MPAVPVPDTPETDPETQIATRPDPDDALNDGKELNEEDLDGKELNEGDLDGGGGRMSFLDHLDELRKRLVTSVGAIFVGVLVAFPFYERITAFVMVPLNATLEDGQGFIYTEPTEAFFLLIKVSALVGLLLALPIVLTQFWLFVAPGLYAHEKKFAIPFVTLSTLFFMGGCMFSHYLLFPVAWAFLGGFSTDYLTFLPRLQPTFSLYIRLTLACGVVFQMPTVVPLPRPRRGSDRAFPAAEHQVRHPRHLHRRRGDDADRRSGHADPDGGADDCALRREHRDRLGRGAPETGHGRMTRPHRGPGARTASTRSRSGPGLRMPWSSPAGATSSLPACIGTSRPSSRNTPRPSITW